MTCIDLTTLSGDDTETNVQRLCFKAKQPIRTDLLEAVGMQDRGVYSLVENNTILEVFVC